MRKHMRYDINQEFDPLRMNAGGVLNTCKSSEKLNSETSVEHLSGKRRTGE